MDEIETIDLTGLFCPEVVLALARRVAGFAPGRRAVVLSTDPLSAIDIPVFAARNGFSLLGPVAEADILRFTLVRAPV